jgi:hypothetical protein
MINFGEGAVKGAKVSTECGVAVAIEGCAHFAGDGFNGNVFAIKFSLSVFKMVHYSTFDRRAHGGCVICGLGKRLSHTLCALRYAPCVSQ